MGKSKIKHDATLSSVPAALDQGELAINPRDGKLFWSDYTGAIRSLNLLAIGDALVSGSLAQFAATTSAELRALISDETGTGAAVFSTSPTLVSPILGTPQSGNLANCTGYPPPAYTGDVTKPAGSTVTTIGNGVVTNAKQANMPALTIKGNNTGAAAAPIDLSPAQLLAMLGTAPKVTYFTASGTWTKTAGCKFICAGVQGGGGGGGGATGSTGNLAMGGAGGGGGYAEAWFDATALSSLSVTVGAGGPGATTSAVGTAGGNSTFNGMTGNGGAGGTFMAAGTAALHSGGAVAAAASGGSININGSGSGSYARISATVAMPANGGNSALGSGGAGRPGGSGDPGTGYGGGGGGTVAMTTGTNRPGGDGAPGIVIIEEYF